MSANIESRNAGKGICGGLEKHEAVVRGVLHDLNNLFQAMLAMSSMAKQQAGEYHPAHAKLLALEECTVRAAALASKLQTYTEALVSGAIRSDGRSLLDLNFLAKDIWRALESTWGPNVKFDVSTRARPLWVRGNAAGFLEAALECVEALLEGLPRGGVLELSACKPPEDSRGLIKMHLRDTEPAPLNPQALELARKLVEASGGELEAVESGRTRILQFWIPLLGVEDGLDIACAGSAADAVVEDVLADMLREMGCMVTRLSRVQTPPPCPEAPGQGNGQ